MLKNPFLVYIVSFGSVLGIYQFGWSEIYPRLSYVLLLFFGLSFLFALVLARLVRPLVENTALTNPAC